MSETERDDEVGLVDDDRRQVLRSEPDRVQAIIRVEIDGTFRL